MLCGDRAWEGPSAPEGGPSTSGVVDVGMSGIGVSEGVGGSDMKSSA